MGQGHAPHKLLKNQTDAPGGEQGLQRVAVKPANHRAFQQDADHTADDESQGKRHQHIGVVNRLQRRQLEDQLHHIGGVGTEHDQLAMGEVDHTHEAENNGQSQRGHQQDRANGHTVEQAFKKQLHGRVKRSVQ